ncbi:MAG: FG-GAP repeat domain-containing protein [Chitinophagales bacterium]
MKKQILSLLCCFTCIAAMAQNINLEEAASSSSLNESRNSSLSLGDIDNDGDLDLIISGRQSSVITTMYVNDGNANFTEVLNTPFVDVQFGSTGFADIDNDGDLDVLITGTDFTPNRHAKLYLNDGIGNFTLKQNTLFQPQSEGEFVFEDVDNDGDLDLLMTGYIDVGSNIGGHTTLYLNDGSGDFSVANASFEALRGSSIAFFDMDNDGDKDVIVAGEDDNGAYTTNLYASDGNGNFSLVAGTPFTGFLAGDIAVSDTDNDGDIDVHICGQSSSGNMSELYLNDGTGNFSFFPNTPFPITSLGTSDFADFDYDGDMDILVTGSIQGAEFAGAIYENQGNNNFVLADELWSVYLSSVDIGDVDGDSDIDAVIVGISNGFQPRIYLNTISKHFISTKVMLEAPFNSATGLMNTDLRTQNLLPIRQPFNESPWNYAGLEAFDNANAMPIDAVDWVLLEVIDAADASTIVESRAAILLENGEIVGTNADTGVAFYNLDEANNYYVIVRSRNHIDVASATAISLPQQGTYDFSANMSNALGTAQQKQVAANVFALVAGDFDGNGIITVSDFNRYLLEAGQLNMYNAADADMNGSTTIGDFNFYLPNASFIGNAAIRY